MRMHITLVIALMTLSGDDEACASAKGKQISWRHSKKRTRANPQSNTPQPRTSHWHVERFSASSRSSGRAAVIHRKELFKVGLINPPATRFLSMTTQYFKDHFGNCLKLPQSHNRTR